MNIHHSKYIIIGAGLSGLTTGYVLAQNGIKDFIILESRERIGGRILTKEGIDLGATWMQNHHEIIHKMLIDLGLQKFKQQSQGRSVLVYNPGAPAHYFESDPNAPASHRIAGGTMALVNRLSQDISENIKVSTLASEILKLENTVRVITNNGVFEGAKVVVTLPPKLAAGLSFTPALPDQMVNTMRATHTWMSNAIKVGLTFSTPFWRKKGLSGMVLGQSGAVTELYEHTAHNETNFSLMGFVNEGLRDISEVERKTIILQYLAKYLGDDIANYLTYQEKDWSLDNHTTQLPLAPLMSLPRYGMPVFQSWYLEDRVLFSGAETSQVNGGYMDGAVRSGQAAAKVLLRDN